MVVPKELGYMKHLDTTVRSTWLGIGWESEGEGDKSEDIARSGEVHHFVAPAVR